MSVEVRGLQVVVRRRRVVGRRLVMMLNRRVRCFGSHKRFFCQSERTVRLLTGDRRVWECKPAV